MKKILTLFVFMGLAVSLSGCSKTVPPEIGQQDEIILEDETVQAEKAETIMKDKEEKPAQAKSEPEGLYAVISISHGGVDIGSIKLKLFPEKAPLTVENFTGLAEGTKEYRDMRTGEKKNGQFYDGLSFHRVIKNFMIQGGDPAGTGMGGPGYTFHDEFSDALQFDKPGILAMANSGPNTNGSQFFITVKPTPWLNNRHTIFGEVVEGMAIVEAISIVPTGKADKPVDPVIMEKVEIIEE